uniref:Uncharacterized protein n=1 Tax=Oryza nivara TaxID=4536 RepID=A0A0E0HYI6_ORYNI
MSPRWIWRRTDRSGERVSPRATDAGPSLADATASLIGGSGATMMAGGGRGCGGHDACKGRRARRRRGCGRDRPGREG